MYIIMLLWWYCILYITIVLSFTTTVDHTKINGPDCFPSSYTRKSSHMIHFLYIWMYIYTHNSLYIYIYLFSYLDIPYCAASRHFAARCYNCYISTSFPHSRSDCCTEFQIWDTSDFLKFSTEAITSSSRASRVKVNFTVFSMCIGVILLHVPLPPHLSCQILLSWTCESVSFMCIGVILLHVVIRPTPLSSFHEPAKVFPGNTISCSDFISNSYYYLDVTIIGFTICNSKYHLHLKYMKDQSENNRVHMQYKHFTLYLSLECHMI